MMTDETIKNDIVLQRARDLAEKRREILSMNPENAVDAILDEKHPAAVVHSFPEEDFYFLVHEIGTGDALEILSLASGRQWEYLLDIEVWKRDRLCLKTLTHWLDLLARADAPRLVRWLLEEKTEFIEFYMHKNMDAGIRMHDQDPSDFGDGYFTIDEVFYNRFTDEPSHGEEDIEIRDLFLSNFLERVADEDYETYQKMMLEFKNFISAEYEEDAFRMRNVRLAEKGFLPFHEAVGIYQPMSVKDLKKKRHKYVSREEVSGDNFVPVPLYPFQGLDEENLFTIALHAVDEAVVYEQLQIEFAGLSNQIISADEHTIRSREALSVVVDKASGYLSIGLEILSGGKKGADLVSRMADIIRRYPLSDIFRLGFGRALKLKWKVQRWRKRCWFERWGLPISFWDEKFTGVLGGLLIPRPMYYDNYETGVLYRDFASLADLHRTDLLLDRVMAMDALLSRMQLPLEIDFDGFFTYKKMLLTLWARDQIGLEDTLEPIPMKDFSNFFQTLWAGQAQSREITDAARHSFLDWLSRRSGVDAATISERAGEGLEEIFREIESEYGAVAQGYLDPKHLHLFRVE